METRAPSQRTTGRLALVVLAASLLGGGAIALVNPPFQAPDEGLHTFRSWQVADGGWLADGPWTRVPASLKHAELGWVIPLAWHQDARAELGDLRALGATPLEPATTQEVWLSSTAFYPFPVYLPQALALRLARPWLATPLGTLWSLRLGNACVTGAVVATAVLLAPPSHAPLVALLAMTPMALFLRATASPDASISAFALLGAAFLLRRADPALPPAPGWPLPALVLALSKLPYAPLPLLDLVVTSDEPPTRRRRRAALTVLVVAGGTATLCLLARANHTPLRPGAGVDPRAQLAAAVEEPLQALAVVAETVWVEWPRWSSHVAGTFGWLDAALPRPIAAGWLLLLVLTFLLTPALPLDRRSRIAIAATLVGLGLAVVVSQYLMWTPVGKPWVEGVQGRYFLPLLAFVPLLTPGLGAARIRVSTLGRVAAWAASLAPLAVLFTVVRRYWL